MHVFAQAPTGVRSVAFYVDKPASGTPDQTERSAPFDLRGTDASGAARAWDLGGLARGVHSVTAVASLASGDTVSTTATFRTGWVHSGVFENTPDSVRSFAQTRGTPAGVVLSFVGRDSWSNVEVPSWFLRTWQDSEYKNRMVVTIPMLPDDDPAATLEKGAAGAYDAHFRTAAQRLVAAGMNRVVIRPGHEFNGNWYRWSAERNPAAYAAYFRRIVNAMRSVPGAAFTFDWNLAGSSIRWDATQAYPGDAFVDTVGLDLYDSAWGRPSFTPQQRWQHQLAPATGSRQGLLFWADFAKAHGKRLSLSEWGLVAPDAEMANGGGGGDNPYFIERMKKFFDTQDVAFEAYFNATGDGEHQLSRYPNAAARYARLF